MEAETPFYLWFLIPVLFLVFFSILWLAITSMLGAMSGWFQLQNRYPDHLELPLASFGGINGMLGNAIPVNFKYCLKLEVCAGGLRVGVTRLLGPLQRPFFVPWSQITVERGKTLFSVTYRLRFGTPLISTLTLYETTARKLAATGQLKLPDWQPGMGTR